MIANPEKSAHLNRWQNVTLMSLLVGYGGYYFCRSNLSVATPLLLKAFSSQGITKESIGYIASAGTLAYAIGKSFNGILCDFIGGRKMFLMGMIVSVLCTIAFGLGAGMSVFVAAWIVNRLVQSTGWAALVKISSNWYSYERYGAIMGILSLSFLFGDAIVRLVLGELVSNGASWRMVFFASAGILAVIALITVFVLKEKPEDVGAEPPRVNPDNVFGALGDKDRPSSLVDLLLPYLTNVSFWLIIILSIGLTMIRETFSFWTPTYLTEVAHLSAGKAGTFSLLYPFFGGVSVIAGGYFTDRFTKGRRGGFMAASLTLLVVAMFILSRIKPDGATIPLALISVISLLMMAPYSFLSGVIALDLGGKQGSSTAAGLFDSAGYLGAIISGKGIGALADKGGWGLAFSVLAGISLLTAITAIVYWRIHERR